MLSLFFFGRISNSFHVQKKAAKKKYNKEMVPKRSIYFYASTAQHFLSENVDAPYEDVGCFSPPREKRVLLKKLTPKKNIN
jgi:hypothetical protein